MSAENMEKRRRIREQLREFYGDVTAGYEKHSLESNNSVVPPELDLDSEFFNVNKYINNLLRCESLKRLVETDTQLLRTVRQLDKELQELVYRNYAKFISSTDTIREMRENITEMDTKLEALSNNVEIIDRVSKSIGEKLQSHQSRVKDMISTSRTLRKVQFLLGLAGTMRRLIERKEYGLCVKHWVAGDSFLLKYNNLSSIAKIREECKTLARQLYMNMHEVISTTSLNDPDAINTVRCVVEDMRLMRATSLFENEDVNDKNMDGNEPDLSCFEKEILNCLMENVSKIFFAGVKDVNNAIITVLSLPNFSEIDRGRWQEVLDNMHIQQPLVQLKNICALFYSSSERVYSLFRRENDVTVSLRIVEKVQPVLIDIMSPITTNMSKLIIAMVNVICNNGECVLETSSEVKNHINSVFAMLTKQLRYYSKTLKALGENYLDNAHSNQKCQYSVLIEESILDIFRQFLDELETKLTEGATTTDPITTTCAPAYKQLLHFCLTRFAFSTAAIAAERSGVAVLIDDGTLELIDTSKVQRRCVNVARAFAHRGVTLLGQLHLRLLATSCCPADAVDPTSTCAQNYGVAYCLPEFVRQLLDIYEALREIFISASSDCCSDLGDSSNKKLNNSHKVGNLRSLSMSYSNIGSGHSSERVSLRKPVLSFVRQESNVMQSSVDFIFSKQHKYSAELHVFSKQHTAASVVLSVVIYLLKGLIEHVRQTSFTRNGFQSVQINCTFLLYLLTPSVLPSVSTNTKNFDKSVLSCLKEWLHECKDSNLFKMVPQLLNDCSTCAYERCKEKVPLTSVVIERLVMSVIEEMES